MDVSSFDGAGSAYPRPFLKVSCDDDSMIIESNGIPHYTFVKKTPNDLSEQDYTWRITMQPTLASSISSIPLLDIIGFTVNGLPIYGPNEADRPHPYGDPVHNNLLDDCLGHTAQRGDYHYHAIELSCLSLESTDYTIIGYALDGFPIYGPYGCIDGDCTNVVKFKSSWIQTGDPTTYAWDNYEYQENDGIEYLDECNGRYDKKIGYHYRATENFPYILGCYSGEIDESNLSVFPNPQRNIQAPPFR